MRRSLPLLLIAGLASCGQEEPRSGQRSDQSFEVEESSSPNVSPTAAPGVAFNYRYSFRLPANTIASVQEQHAQACEKLGINRCRITGMRYRLVGQRDIEGMLAFKLDPMIARSFGKAGVENVTRAEGMLVDSEINGEDAGAAITAANRAEGQLTDDLRKIEEQLRQKGLGDSERRTLQDQAEAIRQSMRANREDRDQKRESLATTPMVFNYGSGDLIPGFDTRSPIRGALQQAGDNFIKGMAFLLVILVTLLPWAAVIAFMWWFGSRIQRRFGRPRPAIVAPTDSKASAQD